MILKRSRFIIVVLLSIVPPGCTNPSFRVLNQDEGRTELLVTPDRILLQCEDVQDPTEPIDPDGRYGLMIHVLDEENTVSTIIQGNILGKKDCSSRLNEIEKIIKSGKEIYIGGMGNLKDPRKKDIEYPKLFRGKGTFYSNSRVLQFSVIMNEKKACWTAHYGRDRPCPRDEFPIPKK